ncbi:MAG: signal peptide peptidase SppA [Candidatus Thermoplasmatota archaeon]|nr:signal peptide peptidase SppA [Candidatus Thermoplasmatota archaeon]
MYIAVIPIKGNINQRMQRSIVPIIRYASARKKVAGAILHINSGGGDAVSSELIYNECVELSRKKPLYAYIEGIGASGAYWISMASQKIFAFNSSIVGSIGVISIMPNISNFLQKIGIRVDTIKMGMYKDSLSPFSTDDHGKEIIENIIRESYDRFVELVSNKRNISMEDMKEIAQGQVFSVGESLRRKLIDASGTLKDVVDDISLKTRGVKKVRFMEPKVPVFQRLIQGISSAMIGELSDTLNQY